jgi:formate dehydrogenase beta subunit
VAICRLKRVAADNKGDMPRDAKPAPRNGKKVACVGAGPASLTVARDLAPLGYEVTVFDGDPKAGGFMRSQIPRFRLPESVIDEECRLHPRPGRRVPRRQRIESMKALLAEGYDAVFVGCGAPRGRDLDSRPPGSAATSTSASTGWQRVFGTCHQDRQARDRAGRRQHRDGLLPLGAPAGRRRRQGHRALRLRGDEGLALGEGRREHEGIPILNYHVPKAFVHENGKLTGMRFEKVQGRSTTTRAAQPGAHRRAGRISKPATRCWSPSARRTPSPGSSATSASSSTSGACRCSTRRHLQSTLPKVFFGGDAAFGPKNIIWAVAQGHEAAVSIDLFLNGEDVRERPAPHVNLMSQKMGIHEWSYDNDISQRRALQGARGPRPRRRWSIKVEVELGFDPPPPSRRRSAA